MENVAVEITFATHPAQSENASIEPIEKFSCMVFQGEKYPVISIIT